MPPSSLPRRGGNPTRATFAQRLCRQRGRPLEDFPALAWRFAAGWPTRCLRRLILFFAPRYFEAEDLHLRRAAECRWRWELADELQLLRVSYLRRGVWRHLGVGLNGERLLRCYDHLLARDGIEAEVRRVEAAASRPQSASAEGEQILS